MTTPLIRQQIVAMIPPHHVLERYKNVTTICADIMDDVNDVRMLISRSRNIKFATIEAILPNRNSVTLQKSLQEITLTYYRGGFRVSMALMDGEFEDALRGGPALAEIGVALNTTAHDEHVGDIKRFIRTTVKEQMWATFNTLSFQPFTEMAKSEVYWLNTFQLRTESLPPT